jgi:hypothetical protein
LAKLTVPPARHILPKQQYFKPKLIAISNLFTDTELEMENDKENENEKC